MTYFTLRTVVLVLTLACALLCWVRDGEIKRDAN